MIGNEKPDLAFTHELIKQLKIAEEEMKMEEPTVSRRELLTILREHGMQRNRISDFRQSLKDDNEEEMASSVGEILKDMSQVSVVLQAMMTSLRNK
jgi:hypothetical protein